MGEVISMSAWRAEHRSVSGHRLPGFYFDLACPLSYLTAERVERTIGPVRWTPVPGSALVGSVQATIEREWMREHAEARARALRLPLVWPENFPAPAARALRAAAFAVHYGVGSGFALAASRLAFCGGFDLDDPETLAEAAGACGLPLEECLQAAGDPAWDAPLQRTGRVLQEAGVRELPAFRVHGQWLQGDSALLAALYLTRGAPSAERPLAPGV
jgi:2-hydroxychromene-2-carboxylate isomerase